MTISFVSASMAVHVDTSPASIRSGVGGTYVALIAVVERPNFVALDLSRFDVADQFSMQVDGGFARIYLELRIVVISPVSCELGLKLGVAELSYMLIDDAIEAAKAAGLLRPATPIESWEARPRAFLMCQPLWEDIEKGRMDLEEAVRGRWAQVEANISTFIVGGRMTENLIKQLKPPKFEHWELLCRRPRPSLRVFGRFAKPDVFVGTHVKPRNGLGGLYSLQFEYEKLVCEDHWKAAGLPEDGFFSDPPDFRYEAYITENASRKVQVPE